MIMLDTAVIVAIFGLVAAVIGGMIQAVSARSFEARRFERESKWDLYSKFFVTLGELVISEPGSERLVNAKSLMIQLRGRIGIVGSSEVIRAVGEVFDYPDFNDPPSRAIMAKALNAMRADVGKGGDPVDENALVQLLFGERGKLE